MSTPKPCVCKPGTPECRFCFLYRTDPRYRAHWGGDATDVTQSPGIVARAVSAVVAVVRHVAAGLPKAGSDEKARRMELCRACPEFDAVKTKCRKCGCWLNLKIPMAGEHCPLGKW